MEHYLTRIGIECRSLRKTYSLAQGEKVVLNDLNLRVGDGERLGLIGENGAGKSTLLRILAGTSSASGGTASVHGKVHAALSLGVGLREDMTGRENLHLDSQILGTAEQDLDDLVERMIAFTELGAFIDRPVRVYSSGMKSRLMFASLIFARPEILLIDEALSAGDHRFQRKASAALQQLCADGRLVILVSHSMEAVIQMCTRCVWLKDGRIEMDGEPATVTTAYESWQAARSDQNVLDKTYRKREHRLASDAAAFVHFNAIGPVRSGMPGEFEAELTLHQGLTKPDLQLRVERLDGLHIGTIEAQPRDMAALAAPGRRTIGLRFPALPLGSGPHIFRLRLGSAGSTIAEIEELVMIETGVAFSGGRPTLIHAIECESKRLT